MKRVCVTGYGGIDSLGIDPYTNFDKMLLDQSMEKDLDLLFDNDNPKINKGIFPDEIPSDLDPRKYPRAVRYADYAAQQAIEMSGVKLSENVGVIFSSLAGGADNAIPIALKQRLSLKMTVNSFLDASCGHISKKYGFKGINTCMYSACATGLASIDYALQLIDHYDYMVVGGSDAGCNPIDINVFSTLRALGNISMPFDDRREGFVMGEGAGCLILESEEKAAARGATVYGYIYQAGHASDAYDATLPSGEGARRAMKMAMQLGGSDIGAVNAHGTSTPAGDLVEYEAIKDVVGDVYIYSNKSKIGHTFAAAGILETIYSIISMNRNIVPHNQNCRQTTMNVVQSPIEVKTSKTLNNAFGFGGKCISTVIENGY